MYKFLYLKSIGNSNPAAFARVGKYCQIGDGLSCHAEFISMDNWSRLQDNNNIISLNGKLIIKKFAAVSSQCIIIPDSHTPTVGIPQFLSITHINDKFGNIIVNEDAWVGAGAILMSKCEIGRGAIIGAGSVVTKKIPPYAVAVGSPAKIIATRFSVKQIIEHEKILYPKEERFTEEELNILFNSHFLGKKAIGVSEISEEDRKILNTAKTKYNIIDYSKE